MAEYGNFKNNKRGKNKKGMTQQQLADSVSDYFKMGVREKYI